MGIKTVVVSDWTGDTLDSDTKPLKLTLQAPGVAAKDAQIFELYMSATEIEGFAQRLADGEPIIPRSQPAKPATRSSSSSTPPISDKQREAWAKFQELKPAGTTNAEFASTLEQWLTTNPVPKQRGDGNYDKIQATERGIAAPVIEAYAAAQ